jgi:hypothetical protein
VRDGSLLGRCADQSAAALRDFIKIAADRCDLGDNAAIVEP